MALSALSCVAHFLESGPVTDESRLVLEEERLYSGHRAFVLATYVDSVFARWGSVDLDMRDVDSLFLSMDAMKTPLADVWHHAGLHSVVYRLPDVDFVVARVYLSRLLGVCPLVYCGIPELMDL